MAKLYFYYASMNAGKSTTLLQADFNYRERGMETLLYTAALDDRAGKGVIASRIGLQIGGQLFDRDTDIRSEVEEELKKRKLHCILIDEAQFLSRAQVVQLASICDDLDIPVLAYGLRTDFQANLFEGSAHLLALADTLVELKAVCDCGRKATMNLRVDSEGRAVAKGASIEIGGNDRYISLCRRTSWPGLRMRTASNCDSRSPAPSGALNRKSRPPYPADHRGSLSWSALCSPRSRSSPPDRRRCRRRRSSLRSLRRAGRPRLTGRTTEAKGGRCMAG